MWVASEARPVPSVKDKGCSLHGCSELFKDGKRKES